jgi:hypothetical protein
MHIFSKQTPNPTCFAVALTSSATDAGVGQEVNITVTLDDTLCINVSTEVLLGGRVGTQADVASAAGGLREVNILVPPGCVFPL